MYYYIKVEETIDLPSMTFLLYESTRKEIEISVKGFIGQTIEAKKKNPKDKVIGLMNYIEDEELIIVKGTAGITIKDEEMKQQIVNTIRNLKSKNDKISIRF